MYNSILVPLDQSELSECSLRHAREIASGCHVADVILLTIIELPQNNYTESGSQRQLQAMFQETEQLQKQMMNKATDYLDQISKRMKEGKIDVKTAVVQAKGTQGVADIIIDYAKNNAIDLIVMSTHGRSGISRWALGSVADRVVQGATVPVLTISPPGCRS